MVATLTGGISASTVYTAPVACTVEPLIVVTSATVCYGSSATLVTSGCTGTVSWNTGATGNTLITPALKQTTSYTATCTASTGSTKTAIGTVDLLPQPVLSIVASATSVILGTTVSLSAVGCVGTVSWSTGEMSSSISVIPSNASNVYSATCVTGPTCQTTASISVMTSTLINLDAEVICYGSSATVVAGGCTGTVNWETGATGNRLVTPPLYISTYYSATCTTSSGINSSAIVLVLVIPQPVLSLVASATNVTLGTTVSLSAVGCVGTVSWSTGEMSSSISVIPTDASNVYSATCVTGPNCQTTASVTITTNPPTGIVVISATVCSGSSATLTAFGCSGTVSWNTGTSGNTLVTPALTTTTNYTATCTTSTGSTSSVVGTVTVKPQPTISLQASNTLVTVTTPAVITAIGCSGNITWSTGDTGNTTIVSLARLKELTGVFSATCTNDAGCMAMDSITLARPSNLTVTSATICSGSSATLTASGCLGMLTWSDGTTDTTLIIPVLTRTTSYTARCMNFSGFYDAAVATITVLPQPVLSIVASATSVSIGTTVSLSAVGCVGMVSWSTGQTGSSISVIPNNASNVYSATCVSGPTCQTTASVIITTNPSGSLKVIVSTPLCNSSTNQYTATGTVSLTNSPAGSLTITDKGTVITIIPVTAGQTTASFSVSGISDAASHTVMATLTGGTSATTTYAAPVSCTVCSLSLTTAALNNGQVGTPYSQTITTTGGTAPFTYTVASGLLPNGLSLNPGTGVLSGVPTAAGSFTATLTVTDSKGCSVSLPLTMFDINTGPVCLLSLAVTPGVCSAATNTYTLTGTVSLTNNTTGGTITLTNGQASTTLIVSSTATPVPFSLTGLVSDGLAHTVTATLTGCGTSSTTYSAPQPCTIACQPPIHVCKGTDYAFQLDAPTGQTSYQWYRNGSPITGATLSSYTATQAGSYSVVTNGNAVAQCPNGSCCPVVIVEDFIATYQAQAQAPTCSTATNSVANANGRILVTNWTLSASDTTTYFYQVSLGSSFNGTQLVAGGLTSRVPLNGVLVASLPNPASAGGQAYTVRIRSGLGCEKDMVVTLPQTICACPPARCVPFIVKRTR